jgi:hypothetical protein
VSAFLEPIIKAKVLPLEASAHQEFVMDDRHHREVERRMRADPRDRDDYGQADYSTDWAYDPEEGPYRRYSPDDPEYARRMDSGDYRPVEHPPRSWRERTGSFFSPGPSRERPPQRRGPSDRVLWAVIVERLEDERRLDLRDVDVIVEDREVTLNGTVRRKEDKRRIEDIADIEGIRHVQNNLRVRDRGHWTFL